MLLAAGADCNHQASNGETPLIGAASLAAEDIGLRLLDFGARPDTQGGFEETALHWAAHLGLPRLTARLISEKADINRRDASYHSSPLGWAIHGKLNSPPGNEGNHYKVVTLVVASGSAVEPDWMVDERIVAEPELLSALHGGQSDIGN